MKLKQFKARSKGTSSCRKTCSSEFENEQPHHHSKSFGAQDMGSVPKSISSSEKKLTWLQSQIIGKNAEFDSPFGKRRLTYADHTASGRSLRYIENYIINNVLPFYGTYFNILV